MEKIRDSGVLTLYCGLIFYLSAQPKLPVQNFFTHLDKLMHLMGYAAMGLLAWRAFGHFIRKPSWLSGCCIGFCALYGLSDEIHQYFVPGRSADPFDLVADIIGAAIVVWLIRVFKPAIADSFSLRTIGSPSCGDQEE